MSRGRARRLAWSETSLSRCSGGRMRAPCRLAADAGGCAVQGRLSVRFRTKRHKRSERPKKPKRIGAGCSRDADALVVEKVRFVLLIDEQGRPDSDDDWTWDSLKRSRRLPGLRIFSGAPRPLVLCLSTAGRAAPSWSRISKKWKGQREKSAADFSLLHQSRAGD